MFRYLLFNLIAGPILLLFSVRKGNKPKDAGARFWLTVFPAYGYGRNEYSYAGFWEGSPDPGKASFIWGKMVGLNVAFAVLNFCYRLFQYSSYEATVRNGDVDTSNYLEFMAATVKNEVKDGWRETVHAWHLWDGLLVTPLLFIGIPWLVSRLSRRS